LLEFCKCGSLIINGQCSKKGCVFAIQNEDGVVKKVSPKKVRTATKSTTKSASPRKSKSSKCITYNLYETNEEEKDNAQE